MQGSETALAGWCWGVGVVWVLLTLKLGPVSPELLSLHWAAGSRTTSMLLLQEHTRLCVVVLCCTYSASGVALSGVRDTRHMTTHNKLAVRLLLVPGA